MKKFKLRFHLAKGPNFMKWQITCPDGTKEYHDPETTQITITEAKFVNQRGTAERIFDGRSNKDVVAWIEAADMTTEQAGVATAGVKPITYNPHVAPHWVHKGKDADGTLADYAVTMNRQVFI